MNRWKDGWIDEWMGVNMKRGMKGHSHCILYFSCIQRLSPMCGLLPIVCQVLQKKIYVLNLAKLFCFYCFIVLFAINKYYCYNNFITSIDIEKVAHHLCQPFIFYIRFFILWFLISTCRPLTSAGFSKEILFFFANRCIRSLEIFFFLSLNLNWLCELNWLLCWGHYDLMMHQYDLWFYIMFSVMFGWKDMVNDQAF